ncbi:NtaA/DmoA family FMN-dependent monooxygenase [Rhodococcus globerulus]|uniref:NtaA/DmoA family FMN-dependent monooxygenase n=1 Tax=Rhodococcus globerulus TaxID=33008 RepID=A0ABU4C452_RHOGO|nr:NtaA/DmoA family FMN-dependent monooxygenase [Rhodococcus globerulus]MDV6271200.1 NtaA/DmoA family FMN-dependent monooxygenase [Rhodococcus globerulus]
MTDTESNSQGSPKRRMVLIQTLGFGDGFWSVGTDAADGPMAYPSVLHTVQRCEEGKYDAVFQGDTVQTTPAALRFPLYRSSPFEPITLMSYLAAHTENIGIIATASTTYSEPYNLARQFASMDLLSGGRAGWNVVTSGTGEDYRNFGLDELPSHGDRYRRATEFVEVTRALWRSWDRDAASVRPDRSVDIDPDKIHKINHVGEHFRVQGPLNVPQPAQIDPVIVQAGASPEGIDLAASIADIVFSLQPTPQQGRDYVEHIHTRSRELRPEVSPPIVVAGIRCFVGTTQEEAVVKRRKFLAGIDFEANRSRVELFLGISLSDLPLDEPIPLDRLPDASDFQRHQGFYRRYWEYAVLERATVRDLVQLDLHWVVVGSAQTVAQEMAGRFDAGICDGYNFQAADVESFELMIDLVVPILQKQGYVQKEYASPHLRTNLGRVLES